MLDAADGGLKNNESEIELKRVEKEEADVQELDRDRSMTLREDESRRSFSS